MTLFQHTLKALLCGEKTETSRLALPEPDGERMIGTEAIRFPSGKLTVCYGRSMCWIPKWQVGKDYAIQPARGVKSVGRYRIENIWKQDVRTLTPGQLDREGFKNYLSFMQLWTKMHDHEWFLKPWRTTDLETRPDKFYLAWRMSISVLWDTVDWEAQAVKALHIDPHEQLIKALNTPVR